MRTILKKRLFTEGCLTSIRNTPRGTGKHVGMVVYDNMLFSSTNVLPFHSCRENFPFGQIELSHTSDSAWDVVMSHGLSGTRKEAFEIYLTMFGDAHMHRGIGNTGPTAQSVTQLRVPPKHVLVHYIRFPVADTRPQS